jgi:hypothetical protein
VDEVRASAEMRLHVSTNERHCIEIVRPQRQGDSSFGHGMCRERENTLMVKRLCAVLVGSIAFSGVLALDTLAQNNGNQQCSLAAVSKVVGKDAEVCDSNVVQQLAKKGHAFEQNQMGLASVLAIGPDYSEKEAARWFERAALHG